MQIWPVILILKSLPLDIYNDFAGGAVSWQSKLHKCVALSTTEIDYIATVKTCKETLWLKRFLKELGLKKGNDIVYCDSETGIHLSKNLGLHLKSKHIDVRYYWICDMLEMKLLHVMKIHTDHNGSSMITKVLLREMVTIYKKINRVSRALFMTLEGEIII